MIVATTYRRKSFRVQAIQVTKENLPDLAEWCGGVVKLEDDGGEGFRTYIEVPVSPTSGRYSKQRVSAYVGDWVVRLTEDNNFKIYRTRSFLEIFEEVRSQIEKRKAVLDLLTEVLSIETEMCDASLEDIAEDYSDKLMAIFEGE